MAKKNVLKVVDDIVKERLPNKTKAERQEIMRQIAMKIMKDFAVEMKRNKSR